MELRPQKFNQIIGQKNAIGRLRIITQSALRRSAVAPHILFEGPPGLGKTTMARATANELGRNIVIANAASLGSVKKMMPYIMNLNEGDVLFIDEIHRLSKPMQELLFPVIEDFRLDLSNKHMTESLDLPKFTFIGATTEGGGLLDPLRDRFKHKVRLQLYSADELTEIAQINLAKMDVKMDEDAIQHLAKVSRGTPRILNNKIEWIRDYCLAYNIGLAEKSNVIDALKMTGVDEKGMTEQDRTYLKVLTETVIKTGSPVGLKTLIASTNLSEDDITQVVEPFLLRNGMILRTPQGRMVGKTKWK